MVIDHPFHGAVMLHVSGEITTSAEGIEFRDAIIACADPAASTVALDLTDVTLFGSVGLSALVCAGAILDASEVDLCVDECTGFVDRVLDVLRDEGRLAHSMVVSPRHARILFPVLPEPDLVRSELGRYN
jgi:anti-anti-sigma factor